MSIELQTFVTGTLVAIIEGVREAQKQAAPLGALVNPGGLTRSTSSVSESAIWDNSTNNYARTVSFDVAVTAEAGTATNARIGVLAGIMGAEAGGKSENKEVAYSRVKFDVPLLLPTMAAGPDARLSVAARPITPRG
jgi:hypothetical protein